ncbi:PREDICTED: pathogenesis-related protein 1 [Tarenaya hassleriana]|uniref:pathogenesis-related protein 1 n=1 Tax=Tarenaya hassleriana TaxID=28532 RepID=UPI00053C4D0E|nr:PREDICTED: pathogenesis-related protein 1 [Tarenaya hassleriana]
MFRAVANLAILVTLITISNAQYSQYYQYSGDSSQDYLIPHNIARAKVRVKPLKWDDGLASVAQDYANQRAGDCALVHSTGPYGENLAFGSGDLTAAQAVAMWVGEKSSYDYYSNSCRGPACGHYTQVVWRDTARLGCGKVKCESGSTIIVCNYDPPGNYIGTKPY